MPVEIINCDQNSPEWYSARLGLPTASKFKDILAKGEGKTRRTYLLKLAGEILCGEQMDAYTNDHMERGHAMEDDAIRLYSFLSSDEVVPVGFVKNGDVGASPDRFVGASGILEVKSAFPHILIDKILRDEFPPEHVPQTQGQLWVCEREWVDLAIFWPNMPMFKKRAYRDPAKISQLAREVEAFRAELHETVEKVRRYSAPPQDLRQALKDSVSA